MWLSKMGFAEATRFICRVELMNRQVACLFLLFTSFEGLHKFSLGTGDAELKGKFSDSYYQ